MTTIHIQHIGALCDTGVLPIQRVTLILGPQGAGKSTLMKILCYCRWIEKKIMKESTEAMRSTQLYPFFRGLSDFHRLPESFFSSKSRIIYQGDSISISWSGASEDREQATITLDREAFRQQQHNPKLSFIPAERNLVSSVNHIDHNYRSNTRDLLFNFILELEEAKQGYTIDHKLPLSIMPGLSYFNKEGTNLIYQESVDQTFNAFYTSSGIQSAFPVEVIATYLHSRIGRLSSLSTSELSAMFFGLLSTGEPLTEDLKPHLKQLGKQVLYSSMQLYIEEPEQNLFPSSQRDLLLRLLRLISSVKRSEGDACEVPHESSLVLTTHSPYLLSVINTQIAVQRTREELMHDSSPFSPDERQSRLERLDALQKAHQIEQINLKIAEYAAYFIGEDGQLTNLIAPDFPMISGIALDGVSDWVDEYTNEVYEIAYSQE